MYKTIGELEIKEFIKEGYAVKLALIKYFELENFFKSDANWRINEFELSHICYIILKNKNNCLWAFHEKNAIALCDYDIYHNIARDYINRCPKCDKEITRCRNPFLFDILKNNKKKLLHFIDKGYYRS